MNQTQQNSPRKKQPRKLPPEVRRSRLKGNLMIGIPAAILALLCLAFFFRLASTVHRLDNLTLNTDASLVVEDGSMINISFVGTIDGEAFHGSSTGDRGEDVTIGSDTYIDDFEDQLIGHHVGETVQITVTFPEDYVDDELREKEAVFTTTINGIYQ